jgi:hypothetical protein
VGVAHADTSTIPATNSAYFYAAGIDKPEQSPAAPPNLGADIDGVSPGNLAVAASGGNEDKVSFLYFDVFSLPPGATITSAVVSVKLVPNSPPDDISYQATPDRVVACQAGETGFSGDDAVGIAKAPARLCDKFSAKGKAKDAITWQWDVTALAGTWLSGSNDGLALTRGEDVASSFQQVFAPGSTASLAVTYTAPVEEAPAVPTLPEVPAAGVPPVIDSGAPPVLPDSGFVPAPSVPEVVVPEPAVGQPAQPVAPVAQPATRPIALSTSMTPTTGFWLGGLALGAVLLLVALVQGDSRVPTAASSRSRLAQALAQRQRGTGEATRFRPAHV